MSIETDILRTIEKKIDAIAKPKPFWVTADVIMEATGLDKNGMSRLRKINPGWYKITKGGGYVYNLNSMPQSMIKQ